MSEYSLTPLFVIGSVGAMCERKLPGSFDCCWFETASTEFSFIVALMMNRLKGGLNGDNRFIFLLVATRVLSEI